MLFTKDSEEIRTEQLDDVIQYAGVDLKEEQEFITHEDEVFGDSDANREDIHSVMDSFLNIDYFVDFVRRILMSRGMKISDDAYYTIFIVLKRRMTDFIDRLIEVSKIRIDKERTGFNIDIINDVRTKKPRTK